MDLAPSPGSHHAFGQDGEPGLRQAMPQGRAMRGRDMGVGDDDGSFFDGSTPASSPPARASSPGPVRMS